MQGKVYFGTRQIMDWVGAPKINMDRSLVNWETTSQRINGTANVHKGASPHREYDMEWGLRQAADLPFIDATLRGDYGVWFDHNGKVPVKPAINRGVYFLDPFAMRTNILPDWWASPGRAVRGGRRLSAGVLEALDHPNPGPLREPVQGVRYGLPPGASSKQHAIPVPPGYTLHLGVRGTFFWFARVRIAENNSAPTNLTLIDPASTTLTNYTYANTTGTTQWRTLSFLGDGSITLYSALATIVPNGTPPPTGRWRPGEGSGVLEPSGISRVGVSAALGYETLLTKLTEVEY